MKKYDVLIVGGGFSGVAAGIAAARNGCSVLIAEKEGCLGGSATNCLVNPFMVYWRKIIKDGKEVREDVNAGIFHEIHDRLDEMGGMEKQYDLTFNEEYLKLILDEMCEESGVDVLFHAYLSECELNEEKNCVRAAIFDTVGGKIKAEASYFIDCSGDGQLAFLAGCDYTLGREEDHATQPLTTCFRLGNIDMKRYYETMSEINPKWEKYQRENKTLNPRENVLKFLHMTKGVEHFNTTRIIKRNPVDPFDLSKAEAEGRKQVYEMYCFLKNNCEGFENSTLLMMAANVGVRESRIIKGEYTFDEEELVGCKKFEDSVARGNYEVDIHSPDGSGAIFMYIPKGDYYTIPYRSLIPKQMKNMLVAGRCISSTHTAQGGYRIMPIVCCIGEGAGSAISLAVKNKSDVRDISISQLHSILDANKALY